MPWRQPCPHAPRSTSTSTKTGSTVSGRFTLKNLPTFDVDRGRQAAVRLRRCRSTSPSSRPRSPGRSPRSRPRSAPIPAQVKSLRGDVAPASRRSPRRPPRSTRSSPSAASAWSPPIRRQPATEAAVAEGKEAVQEGRAASATAARSPPRPARRPSRTPPTSSASQHPSHAPRPPEPLGPGVARVPGRPGAPRGRDWRGDRPLVASCSSSSATARSASRSGRSSTRARRPQPAYVAAGKLTKLAWVAILAAAVLLGGADVLRHLRPARHGRRDRLPRRRAPGRARAAPPAVPGAEPAASRYGAGRGLCCSSGATSPAGSWPTWMKTSADLGVAGDLVGLAVRLVDLDQPGGVARGEQPAHARPAPSSTRRRGRRRAGPPAHRTCPDRTPGDRGHRRRDGLPRHGQLAVAVPHRPVCGQSSAAQAAVQRCRGPNGAYAAARSQASSSAASSVVHRLARHVVVDQRLGQPLGERRRPVQRRQVRGQRQRARPVGVERHPGRPPADLVAGALDEQPARREPGAQRRPGLGAGRLVVLPQDVERPHDERPQPGQLEAAAPERQPRPRGRPARRRPAPGRSPARRPRRRRAPRAAGRAARPP